MRTDKTKLIAVFAILHMCLKNGSYIGSFGALCHWVLGSQFGDKVVVPSSKADPCQ